MNNSDMSLLTQKIKVCIFFVENILLLKISNA